MTKLLSGVTVVSPISQRAYKVGEVVGRGSFGVVYMATDPTSTDVLALKIIDVHASRQHMKAILDEIEVMKIADENCGGRCPKLHEAFHISVPSPPGVPRTHVVLVMEYISGMSASELIIRQGSPLCETFATYILCEVSRALVSLHRTRLLHRDIKCANIMLSRAGEVYLCDFGVSKVLSSSVPCTNTLSGTPFWMAPEVLAGNPYGVAADIFSLGVTAIELVTGHPPIDKENGSDNILERAKGVSCEFIVNSLDVRMISKEYRDIVWEMVEFDCCSRIGAKELVKVLDRKGYCPKNALGKLVSMYL